MQPPVPGRSSLTGGLQPGLGLPFFLVAFGNLKLGEIDGFLDVDESLWMDDGWFLGEATGWLETHPFIEMRFQ